jgi:hypothetical protein
MSKEQHILAQVKGAALPSELHVQGDGKGNVYAFEWPTTVARDDQIHLKAPMVGSTGCDAREAVRSRLIITRQRQILRWQTQIDASNR